MCIRDRGNGLVSDITDVIYVDKDEFDKSKTQEMVAEIEDVYKRQALLRFPASPVCRRLRRHLSSLMQSITTW